MSDQVVIDRRFRGPPRSANGGYTCGRLAAFVAGDPNVVVTLRMPPPLEKPLRVERGGESGSPAATLSDGEALIAEAEPAAGLELSVPDPVGLDQAESARRDSPLHQHHPFEECFVCGPKREPGDGMRITCGPVAGREGEVVAAPWEVDRSLAPDGETIPDELAWSALDCPTGLAGMLVPDFGLSVLGRLTAQILRPIEAGRTYVAIGWPLERDGRKLHSAAAILDGDGEPLAISRATWIELRDGGRGYG
jgi:hypothetical protein